MFNDNVDRLIEKLDGVKEHSDIFILLNDNSEKLKIRKYRYEGISKSMYKERVFLLVDFFGNEEWITPTLSIIYLENIKEIFTSEQEKDAYLADLKCK